MNLDISRMFRNGLNLLIAVSGVLMCACATPPETRVDAEEKPTALEGKAPGTVVIKSVRTEATPHLTMVAFACSGAPAYGKPYAMTNPARLSFDIQGSPAKDLPGQVSLDEGPVKEILIQEKAPGQTAVVVYTRHQVTQARLVRKDRDIVLEVIPSSPEETVEQVKPAPPGPTPSLPRIMDVTVAQRPGNRTRLSITTDRKVEYDVKLDGKTLMVDLKDGTIKPDLLKKLESEYAEGAVQRVQAFYSARDRQVSLRVMLRELIPYHMAQDGTELNIDFDAVYVETAQARRPESVVPKQRPQPSEPAPVRQPDREMGRKETASPPETDTRAGLFEATSKQYAGQRMSFDFVDTDIRNILQLISEVAGINIVWGSDVAGKISMKLDSIPWDQALEMILRPNGLTYQIEDDVLWVVPREKLRDLEIKEGKRKGALLAAKRLQGVFEAKIIEFITIRHRKASDIFRMLVGDPKATPPIRPALDIEAAESQEEEQGEQEKGKTVKIATLDLYLSYDPGTNMIIANGVRAKVDKVKELISKLDVPEKQVMIEARVVDAQTNFIRDLGIQWASQDQSSPGFRREWYNTGSNFSGNTQFSTNRPNDTWSPNIGLAFGWLTDGGLGSIALDASLALGETDGKVHIISAPKVLTVNGGEAMISRGDVAYKEISTRDTIDVREMTAALSLSVKPTISADNSHVTMLVKVSDDKMYTDLSGKTEKKIETTLMVRTGETVVIGGIFYKYTSKTDSGIPWAKDIPILGWLFKAEEDERQKSELLIFLTPTVVDSVTVAGGQTHS